MSETVSRRSHDTLPLGLVLLGAAAMPIVTGIVGLGLGGSAAIYVIGIVVVAVIIGLYAMWTFQH